MKTIHRYDNLLNKAPEIISMDWSRTSKSPKSKFHSISYYLAMFAPALPEYFIKRYSKEGDMIYDPFSGRGTTALKSRFLKRNSISADLNPYAIVLSRSKMCKSNINIIHNWINKLNTLYISNKNKWIKKSHMKEYTELKYFYSISVLSQLIFLRETIGREWRKYSGNKNVLMAVALGLMHGPMGKGGHSIYFSVGMPNTVSMSPNYVRKYVEKHKLILPILDIFQKIRNRLDLKYDKDLLSKEYSGKVLLHNATHKLRNASVKDKSIQLVITSPPYLNIVNYTNANWLKLWLLGYDRKSLGKNIILSDRFNYVNYKKFLIKFLNNLQSKIKINGYICLVIGDVHNEFSIERTWNEIKDYTEYKFIEIFHDSIQKEKKATNMLNSRSGKATVVDKVLVLQKIKSN